MRRTAKYFLITAFLSVSVLRAQQSLQFELNRSFSSPSNGPKLKGYIGSIHLNKGESLSFILSSGFSEGEQESIYLRDYKNSSVVYRSVKDMKIIPLILGADFRINKAHNLELFLEVEAGFNFLRFTMSENGKYSNKNELHFGVGAASGINIYITESLQFVSKLKFNIASKIGGGAVFDHRTRYVSFLNGIKVDI